MPAGYYEVTPCGCLILTVEDPYNSRRAANSRKTKNEHGQHLRFEWQIERPNDKYW